MKVLAHIFKRKLVRVVLAIAIIVIPAVVFLQRWSSQPASTTIHIASDAKPAGSTIITYRPLTSEWFTTEVPTDWAVRTNTDTTSLVQMVSFPKAGGTATGQVAVSAGPLPSEGLSAVSDYNLRAKDKTTFQVANEPTLTKVTTVYYDTSTTPRYTAFLVHGSYYGEITISDYGTQADAHDMLLHVVNEWKWKT